MADTKAGLRVQRDIIIEALARHPSGATYPDGTPVPMVEVAPGVYTDCGATVGWLRCNMPPHDPWRDHYVADLCEAVQVPTHAGSVGVSVYPRGLGYRCALDGEMHYAVGTPGGWLVAFGPGLAAACAEASQAFMDEVRAEEDALDE